MPKPRVLLLCGGQSEEHEVSLASARSVLEAAGRHFDITPLVVDKAGHLLPSEDSQHALSAGRSELSRHSNGALQHLPKQSFDVVFPLLHGPFGEDGTVQGLFKLMGLPFVGSGVLASAVGMDKLMMKAVFAAHGFPQVTYREVKRSTWGQQPERVLEALSDLPFPLFVKPANLGSSVGIGKAVNEESLHRALNEAAQHDRRLIVEQGLDEVRELEVGVLGNDGPASSPVGEIIYHSDFYDYETKYLEGKASLHIPAEITPEVGESCRDMALRAFSAVDAAGLARVDFFYDEGAGKLYLNEINTMPGFTTTSMYPKLWEAAGLSYQELVLKLVELALEQR